MMTAIQPLSPSQNRDPRPHAVVIGAGLGGLAAAIRLGARGYRVTILERLEQPGGRASVFAQDGFRFDAGPTILTAPFVFEALWALCGRTMADDITLHDLDPCYVIRFADGRRFRCMRDGDAMRREVASFNPGDVDGYERFLEESKRCFESGFVKMVDRPFNTITSMVGALPVLMQRRAYRSVHALVSSYIKDENIRRALSFHPLFIGGNPMRASSVFSLISYLEREWGVHYVMGGIGALVRGLANLVEGQGGRVCLNCDVDEILVEHGRTVGVKLAGGERVSADIVVSNGDPAWVYRNLMPASRRRRWTDRKLQNAHYSMSLMVWYFGTNRQYHDVDHHTILLSDRYKDLITDIFDRKILADDFSLYLHRPTATDASVAPPGHDAFYVLSPVPNLDAGIDWDVAAEPYRQKIEAFLEREILPGLSKSIVSSRLMTPNDFETRLLSYKGAAFGFEPRITQIAYFRPHNISEEIDNLFLVGAGTHPGAGMPSVVESAKILDKIVPHGEELVRAA
ncbi:MAG: phytoene desaturase family protein [Pseudomonadota bacterium]